MKTYKIEIYSVTRKGRELCEIIEMPRRRWTSREYKDVLLPHLFWLASCGLAYCWLTAEIYCDGEHVLTTLCDTRMDGATITATISAARPQERYRRLRTMTIAN